MLKRITVVFALLLAQAAVAADLDTRAVDRMVEDTLRAWKVPGAAVAIVKGDRVVYLRAFGVREIGKPDPVTPDTLFGIASTSKAFTTATMAILVDEKKMNWDDPVRKYLPYFHLDDACADSLVTLRDIASHRTGVSRHDELWDNTPLSREEVIRRVGSFKLSKPFRSAYQYNNIMFMTAGDAVASAAKMPWSDFVRSRIFEPLGMKHTRIAMSDFFAADHATGHRYDRKKDAVIVQPFVDDDNVGPAGAIKSSARDLAEWVRLQLNDGTIDGKRIISAEALGETKRPQMIIRIDEDTKASNPETNILTYGLGWNVQDYRGELLVAHGGALNGYRTQVALLPNQRAGLVVLINSGRGYAGIAIHRAIADLLLGKPSRDWSSYYLALDKKLDDRDEQKKKNREAKIRHDTKPSRELAAYAGTYENPGFGPITITLENGALVLRWNRLVVPLKHEQFDSFGAVSEPDDVDERVQFQLGTDGEVKTLTIFSEEFAKKN
jgi:CubicO group peptidase (beta-lactamase class C family)